MTLNRLEDNVVTTKINSHKTVQELRTTLFNEKSIRDRLCGCDFGIMCLTIWFIVAVVFFLLDLSVSSLNWINRFNVYISLINS